MKCLWSLNGLHTVSPYHHPLFWKVNETLLVNELKSKESDIMTTNGVIHVVDKLLYPAGL
jgi:uncharacterized surface protein with fasciclin (FAS1) repeats